MYVSPAASLRSSLHLAPFTLNCTNKHSEKRFFRRIVVFDFCKRWLVCRLYEYVSHMCTERAAPDTHFNTQQHFTQRSLFCNLLFVFDVERFSHVCKSQPARTKIETRARNMIMETKRKRPNVNRLMSSGTFRSLPDDISAANGNWGSEVVRRST